MLGKRRVIETIVSTPPMAAAAQEATSVCRTDENVSAADISGGWQMTDQCRGDLQRLSARRYDMRCRDRLRRVVAFGGRPKAGNRGSVSTSPVR